MNIEVRKLADLSVGNKGEYGIAAPAVNYSDQLFTYLRITDITDQCEVSFTGRKSVNHPKSKDYLLHENDIVFARTGASTGRNYFYDPRDGIMVFAGFLIRFRINPSEVNPKWVKYYCMSSSYKSWIQQFQTGSTRGNINAQTLAELPIPCPNRCYQDKCVELLDSLTEKIRLNKHVNDNLLQILGHLYQQRFNLSATPKNKGVLSDICCYSTEKVNTSKLNEETYFSTENMLVNKQGATEATNLPSITQVTACHSGDTLVSNIRPYFKKIVYCHCDCGCSADVLCFHPKQALYSQYLFCILYADTFFKFVEAGSKGTKMPRGDKQQILNYPVKLATEQELKEFNVIAKPILEQINNNNFENKKLAVLRDMLLSELVIASSRS